MFNKLNRKRSNDQGNAVIVLGIMLIAACLMVGGIMLDLTKAYQIKSSYLDAAKKATQAGAMEQNTDGYLSPKSIGRTVYVYEKVARPSVINPDGFFAKCSNYPSEEVSLKITLRGKKGDLVVATIPRTGVEGDYKQITDAYVSDSMKATIQKNKYEEILLELEEGTENVILPGAFRINQSKKAEVQDLKCQKMKIAARGNVFIGDKEDLYK